MFSNCIERLGHKRNKQTKQQQTNKEKPRQKLTNKKWE